MRSSRVLSLLLSVFLCFSIALFPAAAAGDYWTLDDLESDPRQELEEIKGAGPVMDQTAAMSLYEVDEDTSMYSMSMMALDDSVSIAAEESQMSKEFVGKDFFTRLSTDSSVALLVKVFHPSSNIAGIPVDSWTEFRSFPESGGFLSRIDFDNTFHFQMSPFSIPDTLNGGEVSSISGICFDDFSGLAPVLSIPFNLNISDLGEFNSFELSNSCLINSFVWDNSSLVSLGNFPIVSLDLFVDGSLVKTFYPEDDGLTFNFDYYSLSRSDSIKSMEFRLNFSDDLLSYDYTNHALIPIIRFVFLDAVFSIDISEKAFREEVTTGISSIFQGLIELPGKIVSLLIDGLKSLFIPSEDDMTALTGKYQQLLSERLGFIWQAYELVMNLFTGFMDALENGGSHEFTFPGIAFPFNGEELVLLPETPVSLDNELMDVIRPVLGTIVCFIAVAGFVNVAESMVIALISGVCYYEFLHGKRGGSG